MKKAMLLAAALGLGLSGVAGAQKGLKLKIATIKDTRIAVSKDTSLAEDFNYLQIENAYPYVQFTAVKGVPSNEFLKSVCKKSVLKILKSPASAKFPRLGNATYVQPGGVYLISGDVDSQNSYGALLRSMFSCTIAFEGDKSGGIVWTFADLYED